MSIPRSRLAVVFAVILSIAGCAAARSAPPLRFGQQTWRTALESNQIDPETAVFPFVASPEMVEWAQRVTENEMGTVARLYALQRALFNAEEFPFNYDDRLTLTADQAFDERRGNCLSFTALFISLSRSIGLPTFLVMVRRAPDVERQDDLVVVNRHVVAGYSEAGRLHLFDFYLSQEVPYSQREIIDDLSASALFHTNYGGEAIRAADLARARDHYNVATVLAPHLAAPWIGLGVTNSREGKSDEAFAAYEKALEIEPGNSSALTNMAYLYQHLGLADAANAALRAAGEGKSSPFTLIALADAEMARGEFPEANRYLRRARRNYSTEPEVYEAMARLAHRKGERNRADRYLRRATKLRSSDLD